MASLLPVHIDPEEIQRQSFYLSQTRYVLTATVAFVDMKVMTMILTFLVHEAVIVQYIACYAIFIPCLKKMEIQLRKDVK